MIYYPNSWVLVEIYTPGYDKIYKVLADFGVRWRLNSGITVVSEAEDAYACGGYSKNVYSLKKDSERLTPLTADVLESFEKAQELSGGTIKVITMKEYLHEANSVSD